MDYRKINRQVQVQKKSFIRKIDRSNRYSKKSIYRKYRLVEKMALSKKSTNRIGNLKNRSIQKIDKNL